MTDSTPYAIICRGHGQVFLTREQYNKQMNKPNSKWYCPLCGNVAEWDDDNYEMRSNG